MYMIKSHGGSGTVRNYTFENFIGHSNTYSLDIYAYWTQLSFQDGDEVEYKDLQFISWSGTASNGVKRAPINVMCPKDTPYTNIAISGFKM